MKIMNKNGYTCKQGFNEDEFSCKQKCKQNVINSIVMCHLEHISPKQSF